MAITNNYLSFDPLITAAQTITYSFTNQNTDPVLISNNLITMAEFAHLKSAIGDSYYLHLKKVFNSVPVGAPSTEDTNFSKAVDAKTLNVYKQDTYRRGNVMLQAMIDFLDTNATDFPEYKSSSSVDCGNTSNKVSKQHGMIIY